ncbi:1700_t:CDS:2, partial [Dentiscutata erythropus]
KKERRKKAAVYLLKGGNEKLNMYLKKDILKILGNSGYHLEEWEMTDDEYEYEVLQQVEVAPQLLLQQVEAEVSEHLQFLFILRTNGGDPI